jgi:hypothetical protein
MPAPCRFVTVAALSLSGVLAALIASSAAVAQTAAGESAGVQLLRSGFPALLAYVPQSGAPAAPAAATYPRPNVAVSQTGGPSVTVSSAPLRAPDVSGTLVPVSLELGLRGLDLVPAAAPLALAFSTGAQATAALGPTPSSSVAMTSIDEQAGARPPTLISGKAFYSDTYTETDTILTPEVDGYDRDLQLRGPSAPTDFRWRLDLPPGFAVAVADDGSLEVRDTASRVVERLLAPQAVDAAGQALPATTAVDGADVTLHVAHSGPSVTYPVVAAMSWTSRYDWQGAPSTTGFAGWSLNETDPPPPVAAGPYYVGHLGDGSRGEGIELDPIGGRVYDNGDPSSQDGGPRIIAQLQAPGTTTIRTASFSHVDFLDDHEGQVMRLALYGPDGYAVVRDLAPPEYEPGGPTGTGTPYLDRGPFNLGPPPAGKQATSAQVWLFTVCAPDAPTGPPTCEFVHSPSRSYARVGAATITFDDTEQPALDVSGSLTETRWSRGRGTQTIVLSASDPGSGVAFERLTATSPGRAPQRVVDHEAACDADHLDPRPPGREAAICPDSDSATGTQSLARLPEGTTRYDALAQDFSGQQTTRRLLVGIDRTAPEVTADGPLRDQPAYWVNIDHPITVNVVGRDPLSGVSSIRLEAVGPGGRRVMATDPHPCLVTNAQCPTVKRSTLSFVPSDLPDGEYHFRIVATDLVGNVSVPREVKDLKLDNHAPSAPRNVQVAIRGDTATARWSASVDSIPGAGLAGYVVRSHVLGEPWSAPQRLSAGSRIATYRGLHEDDEVTFQVTAIDKANLASAASTGTAGIDRFDQQRAAEKLRPVLLFDSAESWRPRNITDFLKEPGVWVCHSRPVINDDCASVDDASDLFRHDLSSDYIDVPGDSANGADYVDPDLGHCPTAEPANVKDCDAGPGSAIYYQVTRDDRHLYADYWWFFRYNDSRRGFQPVQCTVTASLCFDHEGDWEGATVVTAPRDSNDIQWVTYSAHEDHWRYPRGVTQLSGGLRPLVYVARGTHANYPRACPDPKCKKAAAEGDGIDRGSAHGLETSFDGSRPWSRNSVSQCALYGGCLQALPEQSTDSAVRPTKTNGASWNRWPGHWGKRQKRLSGSQRAQSPPGPSQKPHYSNPGEASQTPRTTFGGSSRALPASDCSSWAGPEIQVAVCQPETLGAAAARNALDDRGSVTIASPTADATSSSPGLAVSAGSPLTGGAHVTLRGAAGISAEAIVRTDGSTGMTSWLFQTLGMTRERPAELRTGTDDRATPSIVTADGHVLHPIRLATDDFALPRTPAPIVHVTRAARHRAVVRVLSGARHIAVRELDSRGHQIAVRSLAGGGGRRSTIEFAAGDSATSVVVQALGVRAPSQMVFRRVPR